MTAVIRTFAATVVVAVLLAQVSAADPDPAPPLDAAPLSDAEPPPPDAAPAPPVTAPVGANTPAELESEELIRQPTKARSDKKIKKDKKSRKSKWMPKISGFLQFYYRYTFFTSTDGMVDAPNFRVQRVRVAVEGKVNRWLSYDVSIDPRAPEITGLLRDAYLTIKHVVPHHRIRIGQQKTQFGYENRESSTRLFAVNRTEVSDNLSRGSTLRDIGIGVIGGWPIGQGVELEDALTVTNGNGMNQQVDDTRRKSYWGRVGAHYTHERISARLGFSGGIGDFVEPPDPLDPVPMETHVDFKRLGGDLEIDTPWAFVSAEYVWGRDKIGTDTADEKGYYVNVIGKAPYKLGPIFRYDVLGDEFQRFTLGAYYGLAEDRFRVLLNYEYRRLKDAVRGDDRLFFWTQVRF